MKVFNCHPIGYELRPMNHQPDLFKALAGPLERRGHCLTRNIHEADIVNFDTEVWDLHDSLPQYPKGTYSPYDWNVLGIVLDKKIPVAINDNFDHHGWPEHHCTWPGKNNWDDLKSVQDQDWAKFLMMIGKNNHPLIYFMRKMQQSASYPDWVYPLEYPLFNDWPLATMAELSSRPNDVCFLAETGGVRENAIRDIKSDGRLRADLEHIPSFRRLTFGDWVERHRQAKMFLEIDNTMGSERPMRLMTVAPMLRVKSDHKLAFPRTDLVNYVEIGDYAGHITPHDIDKVLSIVRDPARLHAIYVAGAEHMKTHYSLEARCNYVIDHLEKLLSR